QAEIAGLVRTGTEQTLDTAERSLQAAALAREEAEEARGAREAEIAQVRTELETATTELGRLTDAVHRDEVARAEQRLRIGQLEERSVSELGIDPEVLVDEYGPHQPVPVVVPEGEEPREPVPYV